VQPDDRPRRQLAYLDQVAELICHPETAAPGRLERRPFPSCQRIGDRAGVTKLTDERSGLVPDLQIALTAAGLQTVCDAMVASAMSSVRALLSLISEPRRDTSRRIETAESAWSTVFAASDGGSGKGS
jgi:hypothetical protein